MLLKKRPITLNAETPFGIAAQASISALYDQMISNLEGTVTGEDIEALHDMRVASRRLRAALRVFKSALPAKILVIVVGQVGAVTHALGSVRDHDVFIDYLEKQSKKIDEDINWLLDVEKEDRDQSRKQMLDTLNNLPSGLLELKITTMLSKSTMTKNKPRNFMAAQASKLIVPRLNDLISLSHAIYNSELIAEIHQMRIASKKLRYTMEAFIPCFEQPIIDLISEIKLLQEQLGMIHDCDVWVDKLTGYQNDPDPVPERIVSLNELIKDRVKCRSNSYNEALNHWESMLQSDFAARLQDLINFPSNNQIIHTGGLKLEEEKKVEASEVEVVEEPVVKKPVRKRAPAKKAVQAVVEPAVEEPVVVEAAAPVVEAPPAPPVIEAAEVIPVVVETPAVEKAPVSAEPQHPGILHLKELVKDAATHLSETKIMTDKMSKEFKKLESQMEKIPGRLRKISIKEAAKAEKYLFRLREKIADIPKSDFTKKGIDKVSQEIRDLRKKLPSGKK